MAVRFVHGMGGRRRCAARVCAVAGLLFVTASVSAQVGLAELADRIGEENVPTGADVEVAQVEAPDGSGNYRPNPNHAEFVGKSFTLHSGASGNSNHATLVGRNIFGLDTSIAPGITSIHNYEVNSWLQNGFLRANFAATTLPLATPGDVKIFNNSWVGPDGATGIDNPILRRADFVVKRDDVLIISGVWTENPQRMLMSHMYNGIAVGRSSGDHATSDTSALVDGPGRMKPELVAPAGTTSVATAITSAAAALLVETSRTEPLASNPLAERSEVIKAVLLGGAVRGGSWSNNPALSGPRRGVTLRPLDDVLGAGEVNVNTSHLMLTGGQFASEETFDAGQGICSAGWHIPNVGPSQSRYLRFRLALGSETVSVVATWHRAVGPTNMNVWSVANFDLRLWRVDGGQLQTLIGTGGESHFSGGNVASHSGVDNIEMLHVEGLEPGEYVIEVERVDGAGSPVDVAIAWLMDGASRYGDLDSNGTVNVFDLLGLLGNWGPCDGDVAGCVGDMDCDGGVNVFDLLALLGNWG